MSRRSPWRRRRRRIARQQRKALMGMPLPFRIAALLLLSQVKS